MSNTQAPDTRLKADEISSWLSSLSSTVPSGVRPPKGLKIPPHSHVFYGSAARFRENTFRKMRTLAITTWEKHVPTAQHLGILNSRFSDLPASERTALHAKIGQKLHSYPLESFRIDFEDGLGPCDERQEEELACNAAQALHAALQRRSDSNDEIVYPAEVGIRLKAMQPATAERALRTLDIFLSRWSVFKMPQADQSFIVTLPKVERAQEVRVLCNALEKLETRCGWRPGTIGIEVMVESPTLLFPRGAADHRPSDSLEDVLAVGAGRVRSVHFGVYDFLAAANISAPHQKHAHPLAARAREELVLRTWSAGCFAADGATHEMPIGPHRAVQGETLSKTQEAENRSVVEQALRIHTNNVLGAFEMGLYCGWDLHPAQLIGRWAAALYYLRCGLTNQIERLLAYLEREKKADRTGAYFDDAASAEGVFHFFRHAWKAAAIDEMDFRAVGCSDAQISRVLEALDLASQAGKTSSDVKPDLAQ